MSVEIRRLDTGRDLLGEGPLWDPRDEVLYWVDSNGCRVRRLDPAGGEVRDWPVPERIGSLALRESGGAVVALKSGFHFLDFESGATAPNRRSRGGGGAHALQRRQGRQARPVPRRLDGHARHERLPGRALPARPGPGRDAAAGGHRDLQRAVLQPRRGHVLLRRQRAEDDLGPRLRRRDRRDLQHARLRRPGDARRRPRRRDGGRRRLRVERPGLARADRPLLAGRRARPRGRRAHRPPLQRDVRRPRPSTSSTSRRSGSGSR